MGNFNKIASDLRKYIDFVNKTGLLTKNANNFTSLTTTGNPFQPSWHNMSMPQSPRVSSYTTPTAPQKSGWGKSLVNFMLGSSPETNELRQQLRDRDRQLIDMSGKYDVLDRYSKTLKNKATAGGGTWYRNFLNTRLGGKASPTVGKFVSKNPMVGAAGMLGAGMLGYGALKAGGNIVSSMFGRGNQPQPNPYVRPYL